MLLFLLLTACADEPGTSQVVDVDADMGDTAEIPEYACEPGGDEWTWSALVPVSYLLPDGGDINDVVSVRVLFVPFGDEVYSSEWHDAELLNESVEAGSDGWARPRLDYLTYRVSECVYAYEGPSPE